MASPCLKGVVALIVSHSNSVINDKAALTRRLTGMGAAVAGRFSGLVTHIVFRRKPHANKEDRFAEDQALFDLYARIDKVRLFADFIVLAGELTWPTCTQARLIQSPKEHPLWHFLQAVTARPGLPKACIVEPLWIEASLHGSAWAPVRVHQLACEPTALQS